MTQKLPEILELKDIAKSRFFTVQEMHLRFSNQAERIFERLKPFKHDAVLVMPIIDNKLILIKEYAAGTETYELGFVKGSIDTGEDILVAANRELQEEIGYRANNLVQLRTLCTMPNNLSAFIHIIVAIDLEPQQLIGDEPEPLIAVEYPLDDFAKILAEPYFREARSVAALYILKEYLEIQNASR